MKSFFFSNTGWTRWQQKNWRLKGMSSWSFFWSSFIRNGSLVRVIDSKIILFHFSRQSSCSVSWAKWADVHDWISACMLYFFYPLHCDSIIRASLFNKLPVKFNRNRICFHFINFWVRRQWIDQISYFINDNYQSTAACTHSNIITYNYSIWSVIVIFFWTSHQNENKKDYSYGFHNFSRRTNDYYKKQLINL